MSDPIAELMREPSHSSDEARLYRLQFMASLSLVAALVVGLGAYFVWQHWRDFEADLHSWRGNALGLAHTLRQSAVFRPRNASRRVRELYYAGTSALPGIGLPMCLISAELVLKRLRGDSSPGPVAAPARTVV